MAGPIALAVTRATTAGEPDAWPICLPIGTPAGSALCRAHLRNDAEHARAFRESYAMRDTTRERHGPATRNALTIARA